MRKSVYIIFVLAALSACDVVKFQHQQLYDRFETKQEEERAESIIFTDSRGTMWNSLFYCGDFKITNEAAYSGKNSIKISWDKSKGCDWIGFGNSFSNWVGTDLSESRKRKALSFYVRTQTKTSGALPIVAALEDFSGGGSYHYIDTKKYLHGLEIDTTWKLVIVPLWDFPVNEDQVDIRNIKQMQFQLEGGGSFFLDEIRIIDYSPEQFEQFRAEVEAMKPHGSPNQLIFTTEDFDFSAWNTGSGKCHELHLIEKADQSIITWNYDANNCAWAKWGMNWNGWYQINWRGILDKSVLEMTYASEPNTQFQLFVEDFRGNRQLIYEEDGSTAVSNEWKTIRLPLSEMNLIQKGLVLDQIKQLLFEGVGAGSVQIEDIKIYELK